MKKSLLFLAGAMMSCYSINAQTVTEPCIAEDMVFSALSPNGKYVASVNLLGIATVVNLETMEAVHVFPENEDDMFDLGLGANPISKMVWY